MIENIYSRFTSRYPDVPLFQVRKGIEAGGGDTSAGGWEEGRCIEGGQSFSFYFYIPVHLHTITFA